MATKRDEIIWGNVAEILKERGLSLTDLAKAMGVKPQSINSIKSGNRGIGSRTLKKLSTALDVDEIRLISVEVPALQPRPIPVISWVHAGQFAESQNAWPVGVSGEGDPVYCYRKVGPRAFGLRVIGDSMAPRYLDGDIIIVDPEIKCDNGNPCVVWLNGEVSFKRIWETENEIRLQPLNDHYPDQIIRKDSRADFRVIGKVVDMKPNL